jgi:hypothetical protein
MDMHGVQHTHLAVAFPSLLIITPPPTTSFASTAASLGDLESPRSTPPAPYKSPVRWST